LQLAIPCGIVAQAAAHDTPHPGPSCPSVETEIELFTPDRFAAPQTTGVAVDGPQTSAAALAERVIVELPAEDAAVTKR
jgi:hypothetical protein